jgi:hypothetical protein
MGENTKKGKKKGPFTRGGGFSGLNIYQGLARLGALGTKEEHKEEEDRNGSDETLLARQKCRETK